MTHATNPKRLSDIPLWRLLVMLDDAERTAGADSATARVLARVVRERLAGTNAHPSANHQQEAITVRMANGMNATLKVHPGWGPVVPGDEPK